jgi:DNA adenine methylase
MEEVNGLKGGVVVGGSRPLFGSTLESPSFSERKRLFLSNLRSRGGSGSKYRRYLGAPIRYPGGKSYAVGYIVELLPDDVERVVSPFIGGGSVEVALAKELGIKVVAFDIFDILVSFWQVLLNPQEKLRMLSILEGLLPDRETYEDVKERLKRHWRFTQYGEGTIGSVIQDRVELAAYFVYNYQLSYGPGFLGWPSSVYLNREAYRRMLDKLAEFEAPGLEVHVGDFREVLPKYRDDFLYLDPPLLHRA